MNLFSLVITFISTSYAVDPAAEVQNQIKYKSGKDVGFEEMLIQGQLKRPEISVVTGNAAQGADGLLRLRENFLDRIAIDQGESVNAEENK